jgi:hypothetical protein
MIVAMEIRVVSVFRLLSRFYSPDPAVTGSLGPDGKVDRLGLRHTVPALLTFVALGLPLVGTDTGRSAYWKLGLAWTLTGWLWVTVRS